MVFYQSIGPFTPLKTTLNLQNYHEIKVQSVKPHDLFVDVDATIYIKTEIEKQIYIYIYIQSIVSPNK